MREYYLKITADENYEFFQLFDTLSPLRQKIWRCISDKARRWTSMQAAQTTVAKWCKCHRSTVSEAYRLFKAWGWMALESRGKKRTKRVVIPHSKAYIDTVERKWFKRVEATSKATHTYSGKKKSTSDAGSRIKEPEIPPDIQKMGISFEQKVKLSLCPEHIRAESLEIVKEKEVKGFVPKNPIDYYIGTCIKRSQQMGYPLNWRGFYKVTGDPFRL